MLRQLLNLVIMRSCFSLAIQFLGIAESKRYIPAQCGVSKCDLKLTSEHAAQIALIQEMGITEATCMERVAMINALDYFGAYCPDEKFCALNLNTDFTKEMRMLTNKNCSVFARDEEHCQELTRTLANADVNECHIVPASCEPGGICKNKVNEDHDCFCYPGFSKVQNLERRAVECEDIDECTQSSDLCSEPFEICVNEIGSFSCNCQSGFHRPSEGSDCIDIDECEENCMNITQKCENQDGSFSCGCVVGYERDDSETSCVQIGVMERLAHLGYETEGNEPTKDCQSETCTCQSPYMIGNYDGNNFCMNTFFLSGGDASEYPNCTAPCCQTVCGWIQPKSGHSSNGIYGSGSEVANLWDESPSDLHDAKKCFHSKKASSTLTLELGSENLINAVSILNRRGCCYKRMNGMTVKICIEDECDYCGKFRNSAVGWNYLACNEDLLGSKLILELHGEHMNFCEILVHINKLN